MEEYTHLRDLPPAAARERLIARARELGPGALDLLRAALADPALGAAAVESLAEVPAQEAWDLLEEAAQSGPAGLRKAARRGQHRLRSRGFQPAPAAPRQEAAPAVEEARATSFDAAGNQFLRLVRPAALGMVRYANWIVGPEGLVDCNYAMDNRADLAAALAAEDADLGVELVEVGLGYVARRARAAAAQSRAAGQALSRHWPAAARLLEDAPEDPLPAALADIPLEAALAPREVARLLGHLTMARWLLDAERLAPYAEEWLHLLQYQPLRTEQGLPNLGAVHVQGQLTARIVADLCDAPTVRRLAGQLAEQARLFYALGEQELAGLALRGGADLERCPGPASPFLRALVEASMELAVRAVQEKAAAAEQGPWMQAGGPAGPLWLPRPAAPPAEDEGAPPASPLWLPGQR